jgi:hypothetical protein
MAVATQSRSSQGSGNEPEGPGAHASGTRRLHSPGPLGRLGITSTNLGTEDARLLVMCVPAGFERWFERLATGNFADPPAAEEIAVGPPIGMRGRSGSG